MSAENLHQSSVSCLLDPEPSTDPFGTRSLKIKEENVEDVNQKYGTLHVGKTDVVSWKGQEGNSFNCIPKSGDSDFIACDNCADESNDACAFCCICSEFLCKVCHESHKRSRKLLQHNVIQFDKETGKQLQSITNAAEQLCSQPNHNKNLTHYCESCKCLICKDCSDSVHKGHKNFMLPSSEKGNQSECEKNIALECAQDIMKKLIIATEINDNLIQQLEIQKQICIKDINHAFERLQMTLKVRKNVLLSKLEDTTTFKMAQLMRWKNECEKIALNTKQFSDIVSHGQIAVAYTELQRIQLTVDSHCVPRDEETTLKVLLHINDIAKQLSQLGDVLSSSPSPSNSIWSAESVAKVNVNYRVEVETRSINDERYTYGGLKLIAKLTSKANNTSVITGQVDDHGDGTYTVICNVSVAGTYQLQILMDGQHIKKSPSDIEVVANYAYFNLHQVINVSCPLGVALDSKGNIYAGNSNSVFIFDSAGQLTKQIPGFGSVYGIHVTGDVVYAAEYSNNCIKKLTLSGELIGTISNQQVKNPYSVALDCLNRVIVSDYGNNRIQIYAENGEWLSHIDGASYGFSAPRCVALDPQGNIHVACNLNAIMVFTPQGTFYRMYGDVKGPLGIAINKEGYSIVCETGGRLTVFHPHGKKIYSTPPNPYQPLVQTSRDLSSPQGIAMDSNGDKLYVANNAGNNILVYSLSRSM